MFSQRCVAGYGKEAPSFATIGNTSEDRPGMGTAHILIFILARSPEFSELDGFRNRN